MADARQDSPLAFDAEFVAQQIEPGSRVVSLERLPGGVSANVHRLELQTVSGHMSSVVVRQYGSVDLQANPRIARLEYSILRAVTAAGIPAPQPLLVVDDAQQTGPPYLVISHLTGAPESALDTLSNGGQQLAEILTRIHAVDVRKARIRGLPNVSSLVRSKLRGAGPDETGEPGDPKRDELSLPWTTVNKAVLLHGDFWPGNILWQAAEISGVVDWEDACLGDPVKDLSNCRAELYMAGQEKTMLDFTDAYLGLNPRLQLWSLSFWDGWHAIDILGRVAIWGLDQAALQSAQERLARFQAWAVSEYPTRLP